MIVTTGQIIKIDAGQYHFERNSERPGCVVVHPQNVRNGGSTEPMTLPANPQEMEQFIAAYRRACGEDVGYRKSGVE